MSDPDAAAFRDGTEDEPDILPTASPNGLINIPRGSCIVHDAGEEIMELYMNLATITTPSGGLGFLDSASSLLEFDLVIAPPPSLPPPSTPHRAAVFGSTGPGRPTADVKQRTVGAVAGGATLPSTDTHSMPVGQPIKSPKHRSRTGRAKGDHRTLKGAQEKEVVVPVKVQQDLNLLKGSKGDTAHILELGSGTGLLASLLSPLCPRGRYTASDRKENLRLLWRNLELNGRVAGGSPSVRTGVAGKKGGVDVEAGKVACNVNVEEIDWVATPLSAPPTARSPSTLPSSPSSSTSACAVHRPTGPPLSENDLPDLVLAVDCIYNESLCAPLVRTLGRYLPVGSGRRGCALVVVELRSADVLELFLDTWLNDPSGGWTIVRLSDDAMGLWDGHRPRWVGWVGWRSTSA